MSLNLPTPGPVGVGEDNSTAAPKINRALQFLDADAFFEAHRTGRLGGLEVAMAGNSLAGYGSLDGYAAYIAASRIHAHNADLLVHQRGYYWNLKKGESDGDYTATEDYPRKPVGERGLNFAAGGRNIDQMIQFQLPYIMEAMRGGFMAPVLWTDPWQNDRFGTAGSAKTAVDRVINEFLTPILDLAYELQIPFRHAVMGVAPQDDLGAGTESASGKHYIEQRMAEYAATERRVLFVPILDLLKSGIASEEATGLVQWKGPREQVGGYTNDRIHYSVCGSMALTEQVADKATRHLAAPVPRPVFPAMAFDPTRNEYGNMLGSSGRLAGSGGKITDTSKAFGASDRTVISPNIPAGLELIYDRSKGITLTPTLTGIEDRALAITPSGSPTGVVECALRFLCTASYPERLVRIWGEAWQEDALNWAGVAVGYSYLGLPPDAAIGAFPGSGSVGPGHILPYSQDGHLIFSSMAPFKLASPYGSADRPLRYDMQWTFLPGFVPTGRLLVGWQSIVKTDHDLWRG